MSAIARRLRLAVAMTSSWRQELPAATALAVAMVIPLVMRIKSSGVEVLAGGSGEQKTCWGSNKKEDCTVSETYLSNVALHLYKLVH